MDENQKPYMYIGKTHLYHMAVDIFFDAGILLVYVNEMPKLWTGMLLDDTVIKTAFNAAFERTCINKYFGLSLKPESFRCTAVQAAMLALPLSLEGVGEALGLDRKKMSEGKELIRYFCMPCRPTKANGGRTRNRPQDAPEKWELFKSYCIRDVDVEMQIRQKLSKFPIPDREQELYCLDQRINDRGIMVDEDMIGHAVACDLIYKESASKKAYELSGLENPNSVQQLKGWLLEKGIEADSLAKAAVEELAANTDGEVSEMMKLRLAMSKTSVKKYEAMDRSVCPDKRIHGLLQFYGARSEFFLEEARHEFKSPDLLTDEEMAEVLLKADALKKWADEVYAYAQDEAITNRKEWPGFKLVLGKSNRKYTNEEEVIEAAKAAGYDDIFKTSLIGITEMEKLMGRKRFSEILGGFVYKPQGKITLVPDSDKREPVNIDTAKDDFAG